MIEHRAAVREKLVDQEAEGLRKLNLGRYEILARLWFLANELRSDPGIIAGQAQSPFDDRSHRRLDSRPPPFPTRDAPRGPARRTRHLQP